MRVTLGESLAIILMTKLEIANRWLAAGGTNRTEATIILNVPMSSEVASFAFNRQRQVTIKSHLRPNIPPIPRLPKLPP